MRLPDIPRRELNAPSCLAEANSVPRFRVRRKNQLVSNIATTSEFVNSHGSFEYQTGFLAFDGFLRLPSILVRTFGPRCQTLAAMFSLPEVREKGRTFRGIEGIAKAAGLPLRTVKRHLQQLERDAALENAGRQRRRTATRIVNPAIRGAFSLDRFVPLPRLALSLDLSWSEAALLAYCCYKSMRFAGASLPATAEISHTNTADELGLTRLSVRRAFARLTKLGLVRLAGSRVELRI